jgi:hypothetical protein
MARSVVCLSAIALMLGCGPQTKTPVRVMGLVINQRGAYEPRQLELPTLTDAYGMKGPVAELIGNSRIVVDPSDPLLQVNGGNLSDDQLMKVFIKEEGGTPRASYVDRGTVLWPSDFHTWNMVTTYYNFEKAFEYFQQAYDGKPTDDLLGSRVYYFPAFVLSEVSVNPLKDNALFFPPIRGFGILPFESLAKVPLSINLGVVGHEFSHRVFNKKVYGGRSIPDPIVRWAPGVGASASPQVNLLKSLDEGLADYHAYGISCASEFGCTSRYLASSLDERTTDARDFAKPDRCLTGTLNDALTSTGVGDFTGKGLEYNVGTVIAAAVYQAGDRTGLRRLMQKALINAYDDPSTTNPGLQQFISSNIERPDAFTLAKVADIILAHITDPGLQRAACAEFLDRLNLQEQCQTLPCPTVLPHCPADTIPGTACQDIR